MIGTRIDNVAQQFYLCLEQLLSSNQFAPLDLDFLDAVPIFELLEGERVVSITNCPSPPSSVCDGMPLCNTRNNYTHFPSIHEKVETTKRQMGNYRCVPRHWLPRFDLSLLSKPLRVGNCFAFFLFFVVVSHLVRFIFSRLFYLGCS